MKSPLGAVLDLVPRPRNAGQPPVPISSSRAGSLRVPWQTGRDAAHQYRAYEQNGTLFAIASLHAQALSTVCWHLYRETPTDTRLEDRPEVSSHLALDLWDTPNPFMTGQALRESVQLSLDLTGEGWIVVERNPAMRSIPIGLWPVRSDRMTPVPSREKYLAGYIYTGPDGEQIPLQLDEVICLKYPNPADPYRGLGPVQALLMHLDSARYSAEWNRNFFINSAQPTGLIVVEKRLGDDEFNEMTARWREQHQGVANAHRVAILENGATWQDAKLTQRDMQFAELLQMSDTFVMKAFRTHGHMLGQAEDINRANAEAAEYTFARWGTELRATRWQDMANFQYLPLFGSTGQGVEFDHDSTVPNDRVVDGQTLVSKATAAVALAGAGWDADEVLSTCDLPPMKYTKPAAAPAAPGQMPPPAETPLESRMRAGGLWRPRA